MRNSPRHSISASAFVLSLAGCTATHVVANPQQFVDTKRPSHVWVTTPRQLRGRPVPPPSTRRHARRLLERHVPRDPDGRREALLRGGTVGGQDICREALS